MEVGHIGTLPVVPAGPVFPGSFKEPRRLYCRSAGHHLQILGDGTVSGTQDENEPHAVLQLQAVRRGVVTIRGLCAERFLAMSTEGHLYGAEAINDECYFIETLEENFYSTYCSEKYADWRWYVGIKRSGRAKPGPKTARGQKAVHFLPRPVQ
ncbi:fibroblast growth factor 1-like [Petromyzon marinus]|uniref:Fibroblast growth factor n=1 Tax=Petromyzon marinus TaxID=7757 RepID=A0AAJ7WVP5_PETMA|nr:fibroblast growth factor 1-like [Petromyzon marinus]